MQAFFLELFDYNHAMNRQMIAEFTRIQTGIPEKAISLMSHILNAHQIWNARIMQEPTLYKVWELQAIDQFGYISEDNHLNSEGIIRNHPFEKAIAYNTSQGEPFTNTVRDILFHVINHSNYHRAQINLLFRESGLTPVTTDYIFYKR